jgi:uncharacterized protein (TIGR03437 family)
VKPAFRVFCALAVFVLASGAFSLTQAQTASPTPDAFVIQLTSSPTPLFINFAGDISGNGRFVVFESNGDLATQKTPARNNADGNREIFLADYAQRRIFQITNTRNVPKPAPSPTPTPSPSPSPTASPSPTPTPTTTPADPTQVQIEVSNNRPMITYAPTLSGGSRVFTIVFSSNAPVSPGNFDGVDTGGVLAADGNQEIWIYQLPAVGDVNLSSGADLPLQDLTAGTFTRITNTPASRLPTPGATGIAPFVADDNRSAMISDNGTVIGFVSTRNLVPAVGNSDGNPEVFLFNVATATFVQATNTQDILNQGNLVLSIFNENPSLSADGSVFAFISNANLVGNNDDGSGRGNGEVYVANFSGSAVSNVRQVTRTRPDTGSAASVNLFSAGRRLSRDGSMLAFESLADDPKANGTNKPFLAVFVYTIATDSFVQVGLRATSVPGDIIHFPTFSDYTGLSPSTLIFASGLNFRADGTFPAAAQDSEGLNPLRASQVFATQIPASSSNTFTRLTNHPATASFGAIRPLASETRGRLTYSLGGVELGGGNADSSTEVFYLLSPTVTTQSADALSFFTGASNMPVPSTTPGPSPSPTPTPSPSPSPSPGAAVGLAAGELAIIRATVDLAPSNATATGGSETLRRPALPVQLNGVSVSLNGAAAGLYFVGNSPQQINFVAPVGLAPGVVPVVVNNNGTVFRALVLIVASQPDIFTSTNDAGGRAVVRNITNPLMPTLEPFAVKSPDSSGTLVATVLEVSLTGVRNVANSEVKVTVGTTDITGVLFVGSNPEMPGFDLITFALPESLAGAGDVPIIVTVTRSGAAFSSRPAANAAHITISP